MCVAATYYHNRRQQLCKRWQVWRASAHRHLGRQSRRSRSNRIAGLLAWLGSRALAHNNNLGGLRTDVGTPTNKVGLLLTMCFAIARRRASSVLVGVLLSWKRYPYPPLLAVVLLLPRLVFAAPSVGPVSVLASVAVAMVRSEPHPTDPEGCAGGRPLAMAHVSWLFVGGGGGGRLEVAGARGGQQTLHLGLTASSGCTVNKVVPEQRRMRKREHLREKTRGRLRGRQHRVGRTKRKEERDDTKRGGRWCKVDDCLSGCCML